MLYMSSSFGILGVESRDFSQAKKERTACQAEQIHITQPFLLNSTAWTILSEIVVILWICSALQAALSFSGLTVCLFG